MSAGPIIREVGNVGAIGVDVGPFGKKVVGDPFGGYPDMYCTKGFHLVYRSIYFAPFVELEPG
jgi:hypothetical protein